MNQKIKDKYYSIVQSIAPIKGILYFLFLFFLFEFLWKLCIPANEDKGFYIFSTNYTHLLDPLCIWTTDICYWIIHDLMRYDTLNRNGIQLFFENSLRLNIVWECTAIKPILQFIFILLFFWGKIKRKLFYIPIAIIVLILFNIIRLVLTLFVVKDGFPDWFIPFNQIFNNTKWDNSLVTYRRFYTDWFHLFHDTIFRWVYFDGVVFLLWLVWYEKLSGKSKAK